MDPAFPLFLLGVIVVCTLVLAVVERWQVGGQHTYQGADEWNVTVAALERRLAQESQHNLVGGRTADREPVGDPYQLARHDGQGNEQAESPPPDDAPTVRLYARLTRPSALKRAS